MEHFSIQNINKKNLTPYKNNKNNQPNQISFKTTINQEVELEDKNNDESLVNLSIEDLNNKIQMYNNLYTENKIDINNAFQIDIINCVQQVMKKKKTNFVDISNTFDTMSRVYTCRVDEFCTTGNKLVKEFLTETKDINKKHSEGNETKTKPTRKKLMLTTADKLCHKENQILPKLKYLNIDLDNDLIDFAKPSRILMNKFSNKASWPEYNFSKESSNSNQSIKCKIENFYDIIKNGKICPYDNFMAKRDNDDNELNNLDNIVTHFDQETSTFKNLTISNIDNSDNFDEPMDVDINEQITGAKINENCPSIKKNSLKNQDSIPQMLSILKTTNNEIESDSFFLKKLCNFSYPNHWGKKVGLMTMTKKQKQMCIKSHIVNDNDNNNRQTHFKTNSTEKNRYKVNFNINLSKVLEELKYESGKHKCNYYSWKSYSNINYYTHKTKISPIRRSNICKYINMVPNWYKNELMVSDYKAKSNSMILFPEQNISCQKVLDEVHSVEVFNENNDEAVNENNDNNLNLQDEDIEFASTVHESIDMHKLKECIINIIKPDNNKVIPITFKELLLNLPKLLTEKMKDNISVPIVYIALLHLSNEHNLHLENINNEITISQSCI